MVNYLRRTARHPMQFVTSRVHPATSITLYLFVSVENLNKRSEIILNFSAVVILVSMLAQTLEDDARVLARLEAQVVKGVTESEEVIDWDSGKGEAITNGRLRRRSLIDVSFLLDAKLTRSL